MCLRCWCIGHMSEGVSPAYYSSPCKRWCISADGREMVIIPMASIDKTIHFGCSRFRVGYSTQKKKTKDSVEFLIVPQRGVCMTWHYFSPKCVNSLNVHRVQYFEASFGHFHLGCWLGLVLNWCGNARCWCVRCKRVNRCHTRCAMVQVPTVNDHGQLSPTWAVFRGQVVANQGHFYCLNPLQYVS